MQIRPAMPNDLPSILNLAAAKRAEHAQYSPVFWSVATEAYEKQETFFREHWISNKNNLCLVAEKDKEVLGFVMAMA